MFKTLLKIWEEIAPGEGREHSFIALFDYIIYIYSNVCVCVCLCVWVSSYGPSKDELNDIILEYDCELIFAITFTLFNQIYF